MGVDTKGYLRSTVTSSEVFNIVTSKFDKDAKLDVRTDSEGEVGNIYFKYNDENRSLFYCVSTRSSDDERGLFDGARNYVCLILGYWDNSVHIMSEVVKEFGGYVDENDCDEFEAVYIERDGEFQYSDYVKERDMYVEILDAELSTSMKYQIAAQIIKHKTKLKEIL